MSSLFGTDGVRGIAGRRPLDAPTLRALALSLAEILNEEPGPHRVIFGRDTRRSGGWMERLLKSQLAKSGIAVASARVVSTPTVAFLTREWQFSAGVVISASHNPAEYNGIKIFSREGTKLDDALERRIEARVAELAPQFEDEVYFADLPLSDSQSEEPSFTFGYLAHLKRSIGTRLDGLKLVVDCAHGANWRTAPRLLRELGAEGFTLGVWPDGKNINDGCGALHPESLCHAVQLHGADAGICFDGDGDRVIMADETGSVVDGDHILYLLTKFFQTQEDSKVIVGTSMTNLGLEVALKSMGYRLCRAPVGDRFVYERMVEEGSTLGGEQSGHIILRRFSDTGDGLLTALQVLAIMKRQQAPLSQLLRGFTRFPQVLVNVHVTSKPPIEDLDGFQDLVKRAQTHLGKESRIVVRYSGTEPLARVMIEGPDPAIVDHEANRLAEALKSLLS